MEYDAKILYLIVAIVIIIVVAILIFRNCYKTQEERDANINKLYLSIAAGIIGVILIGYIYMQGGDEAQEYGVMSSVKEWYRNKQDINRVGRRAASDAKAAARSKAKADIKARKEEKRSQM